MMGKLVRWLVGWMGGCSSLGAVDLGPFSLGFVLDLDQVDRELQGGEAIEVNGFALGIAISFVSLFGDGFVGSQSKKGDGRVVVMDWIALKLKPGLRLGVAAAAADLIRCSKVRCTSHQV